ncbi:MAG: hypothetical protein QNJ64_11640 [Crocosphaera sp.]|nr:hypothetical protein [Crocosphaera sp.]
MPIPPELVIQCLPKELRDFIIEASIKGQHYQTRNIFFELDEKKIIEILLYAANWQYLSDFMFKNKGIRESNRRSIISSYIEVFNPTLLEVIITINEMYKNEEMVASLNKLKKVHEDILTLVEQTKRTKRLQNISDDNNYSNYRDDDDNDGWIWHQRNGQTYFGEHPECNIPD